MLRRFAEAHPERCSSGEFCSTRSGCIAIGEGDSGMMDADAAQRFHTPGEVVDALAPWTQTPIPPPPESEMPQLSPAAQRG